jgi:glycosyltransferase involved in cell wall biosynthesis
MKVFSLHAKFSSFFATCFGELVASHDARIRMVCVRPHLDAPFDESLYASARLEKQWFRDEMDIESIKQEIEAFQPDVILVSGWAFKDYLAVCKWFKRRGGLVVAYSDTFYSGSLRQRIRCLLSPWLLKPSIDVIWGGGDPQREYAVKLGYSGSQYWEGCLTCNRGKFTGEVLPFAERQKAFLYVGRLIKVKGVDLLAEAYRRYRGSVDNPWPLVVVGEGSERQQLEVVDGVELRGFIQPADIPKEMARYPVFILPSRKEQWGVALHEAACLGQVLIATDGCGAVTHFVRHGWNGFRVESESVSALTDAMTKAHCLSEAQIDEMGERSRLLSAQFSPQRWSQTLVDGVALNQRLARS